MYRAVWRLADDPKGAAMLHDKISTKRVDGRPERISRLIAELSAPSSGIVRLARREGTPQPGHVHPGHGIGFVFQEPTLMPWTSVRENVRLPLKLSGVPKAESRAKER